MEISKKDMKILLKSQQGELDAVLMYNALAEVTKHQKDKDTFRQLAKEEGEAYRIVVDGKNAGGLVIRAEGTKGELDLLFVSPKAHSKGIGYAAWCLVEKLHPEVTLWETVTPYFEKRNIHFYVNRCGFHIVEFFNSHHPDPNDPDSHETLDEENGQFPEGMFRFEKKIER